MILKGEIAILTAVRDRLRLALADGGAGYDDKECDIELDEMAPATAGDRYAIVMPGGFSVGPLHNKSGGVWDLTFSVSVLLAVRANDVPRDRTRDVFLGNLKNFAVQCDQIIEAIDWQQGVRLAANAILEGAGGQSVSFIKPLTFSGIESKPRSAPADFFGGSSKQKAGVMRTIYFSGAQLLTNR